MFKMRTRRADIDLLESLKNRGQLIIINSIGSEPVKGYVVGVYQKGAKFARSPIAIIDQAVKQPNGYRKSGKMGWVIIENITTIIGDLEE